MKKNIFLIIFLSFSTELFSQEEVTDIDRIKSFKDEFINKEVTVEGRVRYGSDYDSNRGIVIVPLIDDESKQDIEAIASENSDEHKKVFELKLKLDDWVSVSGVVRRYTKTSDVFLEIKSIKRIESKNTHSPLSQLYWIIGIVVVFGTIGELAKKKV